MRSGDAGCGLLFVAGLLAIGSTIDQWIASVIMVLVGSALLLELIVRTVGNREDGDE